MFPALAGVTLIKMGQVFPALAGYKKRNRISPVPFS